MPLSSRAHHQLHDRAPDPQPHLPILHVAAVEHEIEQACGLDDGLGSVAKSTHPPITAACLDFQWNR
jgi:hypothetical protein